MDVANTDIWVDEILSGVVEGILQTQWILRQERGPRKEQPTIAGMKGSYTLGAVCAQIRGEDGACESNA